MSLVKVAKAAGVSTATVSRVLNDLPVVSDQTVARVRAAAAELNYVPGTTRRRRRSQGAGSLGDTPATVPSTRRAPGANPTSAPTGGGGRRATRRRYATKTVGILTIGHDRSWLNLPVIASVMGGIHRGAAELGWRVMLEELSGPQQLSQLVASSQIHGAVLFISSSLPSDVITPAIRRIRGEIPLVWALGGDTNPRNVDRVTVDNVGVGLVAFDHLRGLGCKRLAFVTTRADWGFMRLRWHAFASAACDAGLSVASYLQRADDIARQLFGHRTVVADSLPDLIREMVVSHERPDGIFIANDFIAAQVQPMLAALGVRAGKDLHLVSCDNEVSRLSEMHPRLASIDVRADEVGLRSVLRLSTLIDRPDEPPLVVQLPPRLVTGKSPL